MDLTTEHTDNKISDIMFTFHDIVTSIQLSTNCNLTVCIFESRHDIKKSDRKFLFCATKDPKGKIRSNSSKDVEGDTL